MLPLYIRQGTCHSDELWLLSSASAGVKWLCEGTVWRLPLVAEEKRKPIYRLVPRLRQRARRWKEYLLRDAEFGGGQLPISRHTSFVTSLPLRSATIRNVPVCHYL
jgi:hypothetical protein